MEKSLVKFSMQNNAGLTLIEVLIALAILGIALTAIIKTTARNITDTMYIENRAIATWVATDAINEIRAGTVKIPQAPDHLTLETKMLERSWSVHAEVNSTNNPHIQEISVDVFLGKEEDTHKNRLAHLVSYLYVA